MQELQKHVQDFVTAHDLETDVSFRLLDWVSEVGEVAKEALLSTNYGRTAFRSTDDWAGELGDAFFSLICVANATGVDLETALLRALAKYEARLETRQDTGSPR
jgi:NTP pyrophosphatase (non-canonical NTP hydrolase)